MDRPRCSDRIVDPAATTTDADPGTTEPTGGVTGVTGLSSTEGSSGDGTAGDTGGQESSSGGQGSSSGEPESPCGAVDPAVSAKFSLELPGWPVFRGADGIAWFVHCTIDSVMTAGGTVTTEMTCEHENDTLLPATLEIAAAPEGDVVWKAGDKVVLVDNAYDEGDGWRVHQVTLRGGPESALWVA